jgi:hypothetical protein
MKKLLSLTFVALSLVVIILQTSCTKSTDVTPYPDVTASADTISGILKFRQVVDGTTTLEAWPFGTAVIKAVEVGNNAIASANINSDGSFRLILPATVKGNLFISLSDVAASQGGTLKATPEEVKVLGTTQYKVDYTDNGKAKSMMVYLYTLNANNTVNRTYYHNFYDEDGTFTGKGTAGNVFNWSFVKGWGIVESYIISSGSDAFNSRSVKSAASGAVWTNGL